MQPLRESMLAHNRQAHEAFNSTSARSNRRSYLLRHPTEILVLKCMDGRLSLTGMSEAPAGLIRPFRNIGGKFDLGWPNFSHEAEEMIVNALAQRRSVLVLVTYHLSKGDTHRGCAGFHYDTAAAYASAKRLRDQFARVFGRDQKVYPIVVEIETDEDTLTFITEDERRLSMADVTTKSEFELEALFRSHYPDMSKSMQRDLAAFARGNAKHVGTIRKNGRAPIEREHREQIIGIGSGFDWVHIPNAMLIVGPYSHDWPDAVATAAKLVSDNLKAGRADRAKGVLLFASSYCHEGLGTSAWNVEVEKAEYLTRVAHSAIEKNMPEIAKQLSILKGVVDGNTWFLHEIT